MDQGISSQHSSLPSSQVFPQPSPGGFFSGLHALILAAGKGTRMPSPRPKVLQTLLGESMLALVCRALTKVPAVERVWTLVGYEAAMVRAELAELEDRLPQALVAAQNTAFAADTQKPAQSAAFGWVEQKQQLGTGHALQCALPDMEKAKAQWVLAVNGDVPLLTPELVQDFLEKAEGADVAFLSLWQEEPGAYGRVVRDTSGAVRAIVEAKDYDPICHGENPHEINTGLYLIRVEAARRLLPLLNNKNKSGEYYITDLVALGVEQGLCVRGIMLPKSGDHAGRPFDLLGVLGVNSPAELARAEEDVRRASVEALLNSGVIIHAPESVRVSPYAAVAPGVELFGPCEIYGDSVLAFGAVVESHCFLRNAHVEEGARIRSFCHVEDAHVGKNCQVGPYARLRPGAVLEEDAHMGNFVEIKKARLGRGAKANHLSYLGDADVGPGVNIGAGTITCNYDGVNKHRTVIGAGSFIGSNTALVAPVTLGENTLIGAGSVITKNVPDNSLAIARARQSNLGNVQKNK